MNLFPARVAADGRGALALHVGGATVPLALPSELLGGRSEAAVTAGVRPEALGLAPGGDGVRATVEHLENLGHETLAHVRVEGAGRLVARLPGMAAFQKGETVALRIDAPRLYLFGEDGRALGARRA
jgi:ABC-type sugar transport system ATPase subunit